MKEKITKKVIAQVELLSSKIITDNDYNIFSNGFLDSLNVLHIILFMETEFGIVINPYEISIENLNSINKITNFIFVKIK